LLGGGKFDAARKLADENTAMARERFGEQHLLTLRAKLEQARVMLASGRAEHALGQYESLLPALRKLGAAAGSTVASALLGAGESQLALSHPAQAATYLDEAVGLRAKLLWDQSWELAEARARLGEARARSGDAGGLALLRQATTTLQAQLGAAHPQVVRAQRSLAELSSG
jgi:eukaryotic-like serine/threonine-protein kinase